MGDISMFLNGPGRMDGSASSTVLEEDWGAGDGESGEDRSKAPEKKEGGTCSVFRCDPCEKGTWNSGRPDMTEGSCKLRPKLCCVRAAFLSSAKCTSSSGSGTSNMTVRSSEERGLSGDRDPKDNKVIDGNEEEVNGEGGGKQGGEECLKKRENKEDVERESKDSGWEVIHKVNNEDKGRWKRRRERLEGSTEEVVEEIQRPESEKERRMQWISRERRQENDIPGRNSQTEETVAGMQVDHRLDRRRSIRQAILSHMFMQSSASSSSKEKVAKGQETGNKKKTRSWRTFLTMMQWSMRSQRSWVQLAGHPGNFRPSEGGEVLKRYNAVENSCLQILMGDSLRQFVPQYYGLASRGEENYMRLEDLLSGQTCPVIMDCKMGVRTFLEEELMKARHTPSLRSDMYQKMVNVDPTAPSDEEHSKKAVTKPRYMQWRDSVSSTLTLGFRIEGITTERGLVLRDFKMTRTSAEVTETLFSFTKKQPNILEAYLSRLIALQEALKKSEFFRTHELIGSSLLFIHDCTSKANIWMIDFGKTLPIPSGVHIRHNVPWIEGNREDGYLIGLNTLTSLVAKALAQSQGTSLNSSAVGSDDELQTQTRSAFVEAIQTKTLQRPLLEELDSRDTGLEEVLSDDLLGSSVIGPESSLQCSTFLKPLECIKAQTLQGNSELE